MSLPHTSSSFQMVLWTEGFEVMNGCLGICSILPRLVYSSPWPSLWPFPGICAMIVLTAGSICVFLSDSGSSPPLVSLPPHFCVIQKLIGFAYHISFGAFIMKRLFTSHLLICFRYCPFPDWLLPLLPASFVLCIIITLHGGGGGDWINLVLLCPLWCF